MLLKPPYKDSKGRWRTQSLFLEYLWQTKNKTKVPIEPVFTLGEQDKDGCLSFKKLFLSFNDPSGYRFAITVLGSYEHWLRLCSQKWFQTHLDGWTEELEVKLASEGLKQIKGIADGEGQQALAAAKFLVNKGWDATKGRPKKADIDRAARVAAGIEAAVEQDLGRIRLVKTS